MKRLIFIPLTLALVVLGLIGEAQWAIVTSGTQRGGGCDLCADLVSYWPLDEAAGQRDDTKGTNHLTDNNTVGSAVGKHNNAASFVAANNESLTRVAVAPPANWTVSAWVKSTIEGVGIVEMGSAWPNNTQAVHLTVTGGANFACRAWASTGASWQFATDTVAGGLNAFHLVIGWYDGGVVGLQIDDRAPVTAVLVGSADTTAGTLYVGVGGLSGLGPIDGLLDEIALWSSARTAPQRAEIWNAGAGVFYDGSVFADLWFDRPWRNARADWLFYRGPRRVLP